MVVRRCRDLNSASGDCRLVRRKHAAEKLFLLCDNHLLVFGRVIAAFIDQFADRGFVEEELVDPRDLGEDLKISEFGVADPGSEFAGIFRMAAELLPKLVITGVASDGVVNVGLEQILNSKLAFAQV